MGRTVAAKHYQSYAPYNLMQQNPMLSLAGKFNDIMQDLHCVGTMRQLAQQLSMVQGTGNTVSNLQPNQPTQQPANQQDAVEAFQWAIKLKNFGVPDDMCVDMNLWGWWKERHCFKHLGDESSFSQYVTPVLLA